MNEWTNKELLDNTQAIKTKFANELQTADTKAAILIILHLLIQLMKRTLR